MAAQICSLRRAGYDASARPAPLEARSGELAQSLPLFFDQEREMVDQLDKQRRADFRSEIRLRSDSPNTLF